MEFGIELAALVLVSVALLLDGVRQEQVPAPQRAVLRPVRAPSRCPFCHEGLEDTPERARVRCGACDTPHHAPCWEESGRCSAFSCQGERPARGARASAG